MRQTLALGIDFGSLSGRVLLVDLTSGETRSVVTIPYNHGFLEQALPDQAEMLPPDWALQDPADYLDVLRLGIPQALAKAKAGPDDVLGIGLAFTASTVMPVKRDGTPLSQLPGLRANKHAYVKAWKHHAAQPEATQITEAAIARGEPFLQRYGGSISAEWLFPKIWQLLKEAPEVYEAMDRFIEAGDWVVWQLTGRETRNSCAAGYKAFWDRRSGYPAPDFFTSLDARLSGVVDEKLTRTVHQTGTRAGMLTPSAARMTGLKPGTPVAVALVDAHAAVPACGITESGQLLMIMGTSTCHLLLSETERSIKGICGVVEDGIMPGYFGYEAGQPCVGDLFDWFVRHALPGSYLDRASERGVSVYQILREDAGQQKPGAHGLVALDWWNGNRSVLDNGELSGLLLGMTPATRPADLYRALIEATAFGTRLILDQYTGAGLPVNAVFACGGIARKDPLLMQVYSDVLRKTIHVAHSDQAVALGAALYGAVAAGPLSGGFPDIKTAARAVPRPPSAVYHPDASSADLYDRLYAEYQVLHDLFGRDMPDIMRRLKAIRLAAASDRGYKE